MKTIISVTTLLTALALPAVAQDAPRNLIEALDRNGDRRLDKSEIAAASESLARLDRDGDGILSGRELMGAPERRPGAGAPGERRAPNLSALDTDGDGNISKAEAPERIQARWDRLDRNGDGVIDKQEQEMILRFLRDRPAGGARLQQPDPDEGAGGTEKPKRPPLKTDG